MISLYNIKPQFQKLLIPVLTYLHSKGISANQITMSACVLSLVIGVLFWYSDLSNLFFLSLPIGLLLRMALNALDGMMAQKYNQVSKKGEIMNEVGDVVSDLFVFFPLLKFQSESVYLVAVFIALSIINEFAGVMGKVIGSERRYDGPMGKSDRAFLLGCYGFWSFFGVSFTPYSSYIFALLIVLLLISTFTRLSKELKDISK